MSSIFVSQRQASLLAGKGAYSVAVAALRGKVRVLLEPGEQIKYNAEDARRLRVDHHAMPDRMVAPGGA